MAASTATVERARVVASRVETDPLWFVGTILGDDPWGTLREIITAVSRPHARVAVKACHSSGKTWTAARIVLWWVLAGGKAITTAPTWTQVKQLLWGEIHGAHARARFPLGGTLNLTEYRVSAECYAIGLSTNEGVRFQGWHGRVLIVMDEAPGVRPDVHEAVEGIRAGGDVRVLLLGNPTIASGPFHDAFAALRSGWTTFTIDAFATPNLRGLFPPDVDPTALSDEDAVAPLLSLSDEELDESPRPYLTTRRWVREKWDEWGPQSPLWQARVRGRFPQQSEDALLSLAWLEAARYREIEPASDDAWEAGIDVAGPGEDETVLCVRQGATIAHLEAWGAPDPRGDVLAALAPYSGLLRWVKVDAVGQGYYFARHLEGAGYDGRVVDVNVGGGSLEPEKYVNLKAELYWGLRLRAGGDALAGLGDDLTISQLAGVRYRHNARGQVEIESKEAARKRGVKSPDRAEAVMLAFAPVRVLPDEGLYVHDAPVAISPI
jgi:phage terminase large subunit